MFHKPLLREAAYELWVQKQRDTLHCKCAAFLERHAHKCQSCGQGDFIVFHRFAVTSTQEKGSCSDLDDGDDSHTWKALVLAGKELKRERVYATAGMLCTVLCNLGPLGAQGSVLGVGWEQICWERAQQERTPTVSFPQYVSTLQGSLQACWERESNSYPRIHVGGVPGFLSRHYRY